jgi:tetratricopeptide (TPR) repeat protein
MQHSPSSSRIAVRAAASLVLGALLSFSIACSGDAGIPESAALTQAQQEQVEREFMPRFELAHAAKIELPAEAVAALEQLLRQLGSGLQASHWHAVRVTQVPDIDAGCLPGGTVWLSEGLLAKLDGLPQLAAALAWGLEQCPAASGIWLQRERLDLAADREGDPLAQRYRDFRLPSNVALYNLLVATGCAAPDCDARVRGALQSAGFDASALDDLLTRLRAAATGAPVPWLAPFAERREGLVELAESRRRLDAGDLLEAYRAGIRARRALEDSPQLQMHQAELDLANRHFEYGQRILERLEGDGVALPHADFWWGWVHVTLRRREQAVERFERALDQLPRVSAHYWHAEALRRLARLEEAEQHYRTVLEAGPLHPDHERARIRLARMSADG